jgi:hypothetical protein
VRRLAIIVAVAACGSGDDAPAKKQPTAGSASIAAPAPPVPPPPPFEIAAPTDKLVDVGRGLTHGCVVRASGGVDCWGTPPCEKTCKSPPAPALRPVRATGVDDAIAIADDGRCVVRKNGEAACLVVDAFDFAPVAGVTGATAIDTRSRCYVVGGGAVRCAENGTTSDVPGLRDAVTLTSHEFVTCAIRKTGQVTCWDLVDRVVAKPLQGVAGVAAMASAGAPHDPRGCFVIDRRVRCFRIDSFITDNASSRLLERDEDVSFDSKNPEILDGATQIAMRGGGYGVVELAAIVGGKVVYGDLRERLTVLPDVTDATVLIPGCAIRAQGSLVCWGDNAGGAIAQPTTIGRVMPPAPVVGVADVVDLAVGLNKAAVLTRDGRVLWWGKGITTPRVLALGLGPTNLVQITIAGDDRLCMRSATGDVWCQVQHHVDRIEQLDTEAVRDIQPAATEVYAFRDGGRVERHAIATYDGHEAPMTIALDDPNIVEVVDEYEPTCARYRDGTVGCPKPIPSLTRATAIAGGRGHACAVQDGRVWCWILDPDGEGIRTKTSFAVELPGLAGVTDLASGNDRACAIHDGGRASCWYFAKDGTPRALEQVLDGGAVDIEIGYASEAQHENPRSPHHAPPAGVFGCAILVDRRVTCWGRNMFGELGDASVVESKAPIGVAL